MTIKLPEVDAVMVGMGWTGSIMALELAKAGLEVVGLERGPDIDQAERFSMPYIRDELRFSHRLELVAGPGDGDAVIPAWAGGHGTADAAARDRFCRATASAARRIMWGGHTWRYLPNDHRLRSHHHRTLWRQGHSR